MNKEIVNSNKLRRRDFLKDLALSASVLASAGTCGCRIAGISRAKSQAGPATQSLSLDRDWLFGGKFNEAAMQRSFSDTGFQSVTLPHCVAKLSWQNWDPASWEDRWVYRRHFDLPPQFRNRRLFLHFDGVTVGAAPIINGHTLTQHLGGYLPFHYEITSFVHRKQNVLDLIVDSRWLNVPPAGSPRGNKAVDYYMPGGITRPVRLLAVPPVFVSDVFAKPVAVLDPSRHLEVTCAINADFVPQPDARLEIELLDGSHSIATASQPFKIERAGETLATINLSNLGNISLWDLAAPKLYAVRATLHINNTPVHDYRTRIGFREARFDVDGFFLNGRRLQIFGLDRHELFPYVASAMPPRVHRRDAEILKHEFNCNMVRCSHYPQSDAFLDACDELGLMVWEEPPGWQYLGDQAWEDLAVRDVRDMVHRDRNRPSVVIWGVRINESENKPALYTRTREAAKSLDDSRPTSGAMNRYSTKDWVQDVYAYDDYHAAPDGSVGVRDPLPNVPYFLTEGVGQFAYGTPKGGFGRKYRRAADLPTQQSQAIAHAQIHSRAAAKQRIGGVIAWCAFDYGSPVNPYQGVKCPGVADIFRIPKLGAAFYLAQADPKERAVIEPNFYWDFGPQSPSGPGPNSAIFSNCDRLELFINGQHHSSLKPDRENYPNLKHPPFFTALTLENATHPELRIDGHVGEALALSRSFSSDTSTDQLLLSADDPELIADGSDATRLVFRAADKFGAPRPFARGEVSFDLNGPGIIIGDNPFKWDDSGGAGAIWIKTLPDRPGLIKVTATRAGLHPVTVVVGVRKYNAIPLIDPLTCHLRRS